MKKIWLVLLLLGLGCSAIGKVADNLTSPPEQAQATAGSIDNALSGVPGPGGVDLGSAGIGGALTALLGVIASLTRQRKDTDELYDRLHPKPASPSPS